MSRLLKFRGVVLLLAAILLVAAPKQKAQAQPNVTVTFQTFYNSLQPHGRWINYPQHGYCWVPNAGPDFRPYYTNGYWAMTEYGNTWVSNYSWGWAPFHYGNWTYDDYYGWIWVPGTTWGPAWVSWRNGAGHYGWAPIAPGVNINVAIGPRYNCSPNWWVFIPQRHIYNRGFHNHWRGSRYNNTYIRQTTVINNTYINNNHRYVSGPSRSQVQRVTGQRVRTYGVRPGSGPGRSQLKGGNLNIYRPTVQRGRNERPQRYVNAQRKGGSNTTGTRRTTPATSPRRTAPTTQRAASTPNNMHRNASATTQRRAGANTQRTNSTVPNRTTPSRSRTAQSRANTTQRQTQQGHITERRQQSWQNRSRPSSRSTTMQRGNATRSNSRAQAPVQRNTQRARPQSQMRTQTRSRAATTRPSSSSRSRATAPQSRPRSSNMSRGSSRRR